MFFYSTRNNQYKETHLRNTYKYFILIDIKI